jgi:glycerophosphoryl diester phosphodiesterase
MAGTLIVARCGDQRCAPENTLAAFESAIAKGADAIEFDVHLTKDVRLIVHHDYYLGRTDDGSGFIGDCTLAELRALDAGCWFDEKFIGVQMPTLVEVLDLGRNKVRFEIDMRTPTKLLISRLVDAIARFDIASDVELTSAHLPLLFQVKRVDPELRTGVFFSTRPEWMTPMLEQQHVIGWMRLMEAQVAHLPLSLLDEAFVRRLHESGFFVHGSNLNDREGMERAIRLDLDQFSTDELDTALMVRREILNQEVQ